MAVTIPGMSDPKRELTDRSNEFLEAIRDLHDTEERTRDEPIASPEFHELTDEAEKTSRQIFSIAREQEQLGDESARGDESINDIDRRRGDRLRPD